MSREKRNSADRVAVDDEAFEQIAQIIATVNIPQSKTKDRRGLLPNEKPDTPERWISNYAEGLASTGAMALQDAVKGIRAAFKHKYGMSPERYAERYDASRQEALRKATQFEAGRDADRERDR